VKASGRVAEQSLRVELKGKLPSGGDGGQGAGMEFRIEAPGFLQDIAAGKADVKTSGSLITIMSRHAPRWRV